MLTDVETWPDALQSVVRGDGPLQRVFVMRETDSTQDAARRMDAAVGDVIVAARQTKGRGRLGRRWEDTGRDGVALTLVLDSDDSLRFMLAGAVGAARAAESILNRRVGIKWPNDIMVDGRKLAGVLVEQTRARAYVGIGINVSQQRWPPELEEFAVSMAQCGAIVSRLDAIVCLLREMKEVLTWPHDDLIAAFSQRDALCGTPAAFRSGGAVVTGVVRDVDPLDGLLIETEAGEMWLPARTTSIIKP